MQRSNQKSVKLDDIAKKAGVSISTVSRALSGGARVNAETRKLILELADSAQYHPPVRRRIGRSSRSDVPRIKVVMAPSRELPGEPINQFSLGLVGGIAKAMRERALDFSVSHIVPTDTKSFRALLDENDADALIVMAQQQIHESLNQLAREGHNFVVWGAEADDQAYCCVGSDNYRCAMRATEHLVRLGRRRIAFLGSLHTMEFSQRHRGYLAALEKADLAAVPTLHLKSSLHADMAAEAVNAAIERHRHLDAIVATSDTLAAGAMRALEMYGMRVPDDVALVGYDDVEIATHMRPALTTIRQDPLKAGRLLVAKALGFQSGHRPGSERLPVELIVRESCGA